MRIRKPIGCSNLKRARFLEVFAFELKLQVGDQIQSGASHYRSVVDMSSNSGGSSGYVR